ncbi:putative reverse transcriptase domain-containing protein [Tanacetum coccineum]
MCSRMFPEESDEVEKYVGVLPGMIQGSMMASKPKTIQDAIKKLDDTSRNNQNQQQPFKRDNVAKAYTVGPGEKKKVGHMARDCRGAATNTNTQQGITCFECGIQGHYKKDCPKLKNKNQGNQARNGNAVERAYAMGTTGTNPVDINNT